MDENIKTLSGTVDSVIYKNPENGYIVLELDCGGRPVSVTGLLGDIAAGEKLALTGKYENSPKYGQQFKADFCKRELPETPDEIARYLGSGIIRGLGIKTAFKITDKFGTETLSVIENNPEELTTIKGLTHDKALMISAEYRRLNGMNTLAEFLGAYKISPATATAVWQRYGASSAALIKENPYILCEEGIELDFEIADGMAAQFGFDANDSNRVKAGIIYVLSENANVGHTCLPADKLREAVCGSLGVTGDAFEIALYESVDEKRLFIHEIKKREFIFLSAYYKAERYIADKLSQMLKMHVVTDNDFSDDIKGIEWSEGIRYEILQKAAINGCLGNNLFILTGGPGTGKTTTLNAVIQLLRSRRQTLVLAAPTGRAAKRMSELTGVPARTIHRLLEVDAAGGENLMTFKKNELNPIKADVIIIDEMSMVDALLFDALLRAVKPDSKLIMVGDADQLPSVGAGNILRDLIASDLIPCVCLKEIFRQAAESLIVTNAHRIVCGEEPELNIKDKDFFFMNCDGEAEIARLVVSLVKERLPAAYGFNPIDDIQVLTPTKMGPAGTKELNRALQLALNPPSVKKKELKYYDAAFRVGDKVMQVVNDYNVAWTRGGDKGTGVFNGDIGIISDVDVNAGNLLINFDGRVCAYPSNLLNKIEHAFAVTVHKSQGSEYNAVILPLPSGARRLLYRNLLYTGVTRARDLLIVAGQRETVFMMTRNDRKTLRYSCIKEMLKSTNA